jgi:hypothetical protein
MSLASLMIRLLQYDDAIRVNQGEIIPTDGVVIYGEGTVDESSLTGESMPIPKSRGSSMTAGATLTHGSVDMIVTHLNNLGYNGRCLLLVDRTGLSRSCGSDGWLAVARCWCLLPGRFYWVDVGRKAEEGSGLGRSHHQWYWVRDCHCGRVLPLCTRYLGESPVQHLQIYECTDR